MTKRKINTKLLHGQPLLDVLDIISFFTKVSSKKSEGHYINNKEKWPEYFKTKKSKYIETQYELDMLYYGVQDNFLSKLFMGGNEIRAKNNSCEVIAVYNALENMGARNEETDFPELLRYFEHHSAILKGYFGTSITGVNKYFKKNGFDTKALVGKKITHENTAIIEKEYETYIFMSYNNIENIKDMIHTMCISKEEKGFVIHNSYDKVTYYDSLFEAVEKYNSRCFSSRPIIVIGIRRKTDN